MAVYTILSDQDVEFIREAFGLGAIMTFKGIAEGVQNSNYFLETEDARYILTIYAVSYTHLDVYKRQDVITRHRQLRQHRHPVDRPGGRPARANRSFADPDDVHRACGRDRPGSLDDLAHPGRPGAR